MVSILFIFHIPKLWDVTRSLVFPLQRRQKTCWWRGVDDVNASQLGTPREGVMSTAAGFPSVMKPRYVNPVGKIQNLEGDAC
jgi:hypothetical protein